MTIDAETLKTLGLSVEEIANRVVQAITTQLMVEHSIEDPDDYADSDLARRLEEAIRVKVDQKIEEIAKAHVVPGVAEKIDTIILQRTNDWGHAIGKPVTFTEYLVERAEHYLKEEVNYEGKSREESRDSYNWRSSKMTRIVNLIDRYLESAIQTAMKDAVQTVLGSMSQALTETARLKLEEMVATIKVNVTQGKH